MLLLGVEGSSSSVDWFGDLKYNNTYVSTSHQLFFGVWYQDFLILVG
jgi:hypothetical protein